MSKETVLHILYLIVWPWFHLVHPIRVSGREHIPEGAAVVCPNHTTAGDPVYAVFALGWKNPVETMAKKEILQWPVLGWLLSKAGVFAVDRERTDMRAVKTSLRCLKEGRKLLMFPEGTRVREGESVEAKMGAALFATRTGAPLLPVYIQPKKRRFRPTRVSFGQPIYPKIAGKKATQEELQNITRELMDRIHALEEEKG